jgi:hypothetical protein
MPDRRPEPWESGAPGPFLWIEGSPVEVWRRDRPFRPATHDEWGPAGPQTGPHSSRGPLWPIYRPAPGS